MASKKKDEARKDEGILDPRSIEELRESNEVLSLFMRHSPVYSYIKEVTSTESRILQASDNYQRMLGSSSLDIVGKTMTELFPPAFAAKMIADDWTVVANGSMLQVEKDLDDRSYISIKFPFVQGDKKLLAGYMFDITERKQAEKSLEKREQLLKEAQQATQMNESIERNRAEDRLKDVEDKLREAEEKQRAGEEKIREVKDKLREAENKLRAGEGKLQEIDNKLQAGDEKLRQAEDKLRAGEGKLQEIDDKLRAGDEKLLEAEDKLRASEEKLQQFEEKPRAVEEKVREVENKLRAGEGKLQEIDDKLRAGDEKLQQAEDKLRESEDRLRASEQKLRQAEEKPRAVEEKVREVENKLRAGEQKLQASDGKLRDGEEKLRKLDDKLRAGEEKLRAGEDKLHAGEQKLREAEEKLRKLEDQLRAEGITPASREEKEALSEVHNHVKNNMSSIIALMEMQRKMQGKPLGMLLAKPALTDSAFSALESRIESIALIHERLYQSQNPSRIDFQDYLSALVVHLRTSLDAPPELVCSVDATGIALKLDTAVPVGMIVNELVTNAFKYAFPKNQPCSGADKCEITVSLERRNAEYTLTVDDNGVGLPKMPVLAKTSTLGLRLVRMLGVDQLGGKLTVNRTHGTRFVLKFNVKE